MKLSDLRGLEDIELALRERDVAEEYTSVRFQHYTSQLSNSSRIKELRRNIARIKTVMRERELERGLPLGGLLASVDSKVLRERTKYNKIRAQFGVEAAGKE